MRESPFTVTSHTGWAILLKIDSSPEIILCLPLKLQATASKSKARLFVGNKAKRQISKRVFQENKARQILPKTNVRVRIRG